MRCPAGRGRMICWCAGREPDRSGRVACLSVSGFHDVAYTDWGPADAEDVVVCLHGLTRQGRDFDVLAMALAREGYRVVCPDLPGRGRSDWLPNAFELPLFCADMVTVVASLNAKRLHRARDLARRPDRHPSRVQAAQPDQGSRRQRHRAGRPRRRDGARRGPPAGRNPPPSPRWRRRSSRRARSTPPAARSTRSSGGTWRCTRSGATRRPGATSR